MRPLQLSRRRIALGGLCLCCLPALARPAGATTLLDEVAPGIHIRRGLTEDATAANDDAIANIGFIIGRDAVAVIDPGGSVADGQSLLDAIRRVTPLPIRYVVMTHIHPDHIFGAAAFIPENAVFVGHANLPRLLGARGKFYQDGLTRLLGAERTGAFVVPTRLVDDRLDLDLGARTLTLTAHPPAHTECDLSVMDADTGTLLTGDLLFAGRVPSLDGDLRGWIALLDTLTAAGTRNAVPGHGPTRVDWPEAAANLSRYLTVLLEDTRAALARGVPIEEAAETVALSERDRWALFDDYNGRNVIEAYRRLEWE